MLIYRKDKSVPLSADEVDSNFSTLLNFIKLFKIYDWDSHFSMVHAHKIAVNDVLVSESVVITSTSHADIKNICFRVNSGTYYKFTESNIIDSNLFKAYVSLELTDLNEFTPRLNVNEPFPMDGYMLFTFNNTAVDFVFSTSPIVI